MIRHHDMIDFHTQPVSGWMELTSASTSEVIEDRPVVVGKQVKTLVTKALRSKLLTEDLSRFSSFLRFPKFELDAIFSKFLERSEK